MSEEPSPGGITLPEVHVWDAYLRYLFLGSPARPQSYNQRFGVALEEVACLKPLGCP
jgi:hypothetical protein